MADEWSCPICGYKSNTFSGIRIHFVKMHMNGKCPVCSKKFRSLMRHFERLSDCDMMHAICYGLAGKIGGGHGRSQDAKDWFRECRNLAYEVLRC